MSSITSFKATTPTVQRGEALDLEIFCTGNGTVTCELNGTGDARFEENSDRSITFHASEFVKNIFTVHLTSPHASLVRILAHYESEEDKKSTDVNLV